MQGIIIIYFIIRNEVHSIRCLAHICLENDQRKEQLLKEHSRNVATYASENLKKIGFSKLAYLAGIIHDMGKYSDAFNTYLEASFRGEKVDRGSVNHTFAGVIYLLEKFHVGRKCGYDTLACEIIAYAAGSHHGEFDAVNLESRSGFEHRLNTSREELEYKQVVKRFLEECASEDEIEELFTAATEEVHIFFEQVRLTLKDEETKQKQSDFALGMLARMVLSAVINADRMDTAEFMKGIAYPRNKMTKNLWKRQRIFMEKKLGEFNQDSSINQIRSVISNQCLDASQRGDGIYRISVPTGAGKTLSMLRYALALAEETEKEHIIFIIPLLSVLDQNSEVISDYIRDKDLILEHHSNVIQAKEGKELDEFEFLTETWDAPIIITTLYQLLMNLFSDKTTAIRRMQSLSNSIIVLDEAQSLPFKLTYQFNMAINFLATFCNTTVVLSSATQPCFEQVRNPLRFSMQPDLLSLSSEMRKVFKRTEIKNHITAEGMTMEELVEFNTSLLSTSTSVLTICNTKKTAKDLYNKLKLMNSEDTYVLFHLSTSMCTRHRLDTIREIKECLQAKRKMICVATQLVEAGIDFSFESVIRIYAGMDNIVQAAGRCNRSNEYGYICCVYLVKLREENLSRLKDIQIAQNCMQNLLIAYNHNPKKFQDDLLSDESLNFYYQGLFRMLEREEKLSYPVKNKMGDKEELFELLSSNMKYNKRKEYQGTYVLKQAFKTAGSLFTVFDSRTTDIIVPYNEEAKELISDLLSKKAQYDFEFTRSCLKRVKQYTIQIWDYQKEKLFKDGLIYFDDSGHLIILQSQSYSLEIGLDEENYMF